MWVWRKPTFAYRSKEAKLLYISMENQYPLGLYWNPPTFFIKNSCFVLLICDRHFILFFLCHASAFVTNHRCMRNVYILWLPSTTVRRSKKRCLSRFKYGYFSYKNASIWYRWPLFTPRSRVKQILTWIDAVYLTAFGLLKKTPTHCHYKAWKSKEQF